MIEKQLNNRIVIQETCSPTQVARDPATPGGKRRENLSLVRVKAASGAKTPDHVNKPLARTETLLVESGL